MRMRERAALAEPLRIGVCGAGRVFERLYVPAIASIPGLRISAIADPSAERRLLAGADGTRICASVDEMLGAGELDAVVVLSPPQLHYEHTLAALCAGLPVLVEKPAAESTAQLREWQAEGAAGLVTASFSRRSWRRYRRLKATERNAGALRLVLETNAESWGPIEQRPADPLHDLMPHLIDLARWITGERAVAVVAGTSGDGYAELDLELADARTVTCIAGTADAYAEYVEADGVRRMIGPPSARVSALRRLTRRPDEEVSAFAAMLRRWEARLRGEPARGLPGFRDAWASVAALEAYGASRDAGGMRVELARLTS